MRFLRLSIPLALVVIACSGGATDDDDDDDDDGEGAGNEGAGNEGAGSQGGSGPGATIVVEHVFLGVKTFNGVESPDAWESFGFNLDGQDTTNDFSNHCQPFGGAPPSALFPDGPAGVDNSWGKYLIPILKTAASSGGGGSLDESCDMVIANGEASWAIQFEALAGGGEPVESPGAFFDVRDRMGATWLKAPESFAGDAPLVMFPGGTTQNSAWSSGSGTDVLTLNIPFVGTGLPLRLHRPRIRMTVDASGTYTGIIGGVLDTEEFIAGFADAAGPLISCDPDSINSVLNQLRQASDIIVNGPQDPSLTCNGISFGIGFTAAAQEIGDFTSLLEPPEDPCGEGGGG